MTTPLPEFREFRGRVLLKAILLTVDLAALGLAAFIVVASVQRGESSSIAIRVVPCLGVLLWLALLTNRTFSVLRIDGQGVGVSRLLGGVNVRWADVKAVHVWTEIQHGMHGGEAFEPLAALLGSDERKLLLLKSTYEPAMFSALVDFAQGAGIAVRKEKP